MNKNGKILCFYKKIYNMQYNIKFMDFFRGLTMNWYQLQDLPVKTFTCGHCSNIIASEKGYKVGNYDDGSGSLKAAIYICPQCHGPNFNVDNRGIWIPGHTIGEKIDSLPDDIETLYEESRLCAKNNCFTASVLLSRKLLMNIAVREGAEAGLSFIKYVEYLSNKGYIPPNGKEWVDHIRKKGNEATHEIQMMSKGDAEDLISFSGMLLKFMYEFPAKIQMKAIPSTNN
ncbi:hypothetical protein BLM37_04415 [Candidatus Gracilibacteria bacterium GN02-873]|nr:hypothetical protein BLM37_04415 [Candidatus Gracilibacteria bacterium GN02-873]